MPLSCLHESGVANNAGYKTRVESARFHAGKTSNTQKSMLPNALLTNSVRDAAGTDVPFERRSEGSNETEFRATAETPTKPHRLSIKHQESGKGFNKRRRSVVRFDKTVASDVDDTVLVTTSAYLVVDAPVGALNSYAEIRQAVANLMGFVANDSTNSAILFACTGLGAKAAVEGTL